MGEADFPRLFVRLEHREIDDEAQLKAVRVYQIQPPAEFLADLPGEPGGGVGLVGDEEQHAAGLHPGAPGQLVAALVRQIFVDGPLVPAVGRDLDVPQPLHADALGELQHALEKAARPGGAARHVDGAHGLAAERGERGALEKVGHVENPQRVAQVRLIRAVLQHGLRVGDAAERRRRDGLVRKSGEGLAQHLLRHGEHVLLRGEGHLEIELVKLAGGAVGAGVLVAEARRNLKVPVEAGNHQQLLEDLRRLRQRVEFTRVPAAGNQVVARALRRRGGKDRGLDLQKAELRHLPPQK